MPWHRGAVAWYARVDKCIPFTPGYFVVLKIKVTGQCHFMLFFIVVAIPLAWRGPHPKTTRYNPHKPNGRMLSEHHVYERLVCE